MPSVNTTSIRQEITSAEEQLDLLVSAGKVSDESRVLINTLLMMLKLLVSIFLEKNTRKNSSNSSLPSSQTPKDRSAKKTRCKSGKRENKADEAFGPTRTVETNTIAPVNSCGHCGANLRSVEPSAHERRTLIDLVFEKHVDHTDAEIKQCPVCDKQSKGEFATHLAGPLQYGPGIKAYIIDLLVKQLVSLNRVQSHLLTIVGRQISEAVMLKYLLQLHVALEIWEADAIAQLLRASVLHADETGLNVEKKNYWIHVCSAGDITLKRLHEKRRTGSSHE